MWTNKIDESKQRVEILQKEWQNESYKMKRIEEIYMQTLDSDLNAEDKECDKIDELARTNNVWYESSVEANNQFELTKDAKPNR